MPPFHQKPGADEARRRRIPFTGLRLRSNEVAAWFLGKPLGLGLFWYCALSPPSQIHAYIFPRNFALKNKNSLSGGVYNFLSGCKTLRAGAARNFPTVAVRQKYSRGNGG